MISPVTVTTLPGTGFPSTDAPTVVVDHGSAGLSPSGPMALSQPPSGVICGCSTPPDDDFLGAAFFSSAAVRVKARAAIVKDANSVLMDIVLLDTGIQTDRNDYCTCKISTEANQRRFSNSTQPFNSAAANSFTPASNVTRTPSRAVACQSSVVRTASGCHIDGIDVKN